MVDTMQIISTSHSEASSCIEDPVYRVNFWSRESPETAWNLEAFTLSKTEGVNEVLEWAENDTQRRQFEIFVEAEDEPTEFGRQAATSGFPRKASLIRLAGTNPNLSTIEGPSVSAVT